MEHRSRTRVGYSNCTAVKYSVEIGAEINTKNGCDETPLENACGIQ
jgi:hypothetical protein